VTTSKTHKFRSNDFLPGCIRFLRDQNGATAIEYALLASLLGVVITGSLMLIGTTLDGFFVSVVEAFDPDGSGNCPGNTTAAENANESSAVASCNTD
jgi:pilus assembly protein Flp/PilA